ncbi:Smr/MutS family protein [Aurantiacibacter marinus]|uniref:DNA mismatch repair protein MutS n=1 Tax=Aurantiacibacter marinus TaxID=874156 RepID=A0A0H0XPC0_9SPHN|nr:Smr/MutS family protein [Aurantiacibacter marinus]KLI64443.1 DNA mismatch repair protein MutS [Aurantiacibacter marinus]
MSSPRGLTPQEAALWGKLASTVEPMRKDGILKPSSPAPIIAGKAASPLSKPKAGVPGSVRERPRMSGIAAPSAPPPAPPPARNAGLDSHWERRLSRNSTDPDFTLDLHGHTLEQAYRRLDAGIMQAKAMGARLVLVVTGKPRPVDAADRAERRGAIRAKILDWLAAGQHASDIAAIRKAHRRHGGEGALYLVLKRRR